MKSIGLGCLLCALASAFACGDDGMAPVMTPAGQPGGDGDLAPSGDGDLSGPDVMGDGDADMIGDGDGVSIPGPGDGDLDAPGDGDMGPPGDGDDPPKCVPDRATYTTEVRPIFEQRCGRCHGLTPNFGAPFSLMDYDGLVAGDAPRRAVDRIWAVLGAGTMPPPGNVRPTPEEHERVTRWASCGEQVPAYPAGLTASRPKFEAPQQPSSDATLIELTAQGFTVPEQAQDLYENFMFEAVVDEEVFVQRLDVRLDQTRVVHHITLQLMPGNVYLYAWAPGTNPVELPNGGLRIGPGDAFRVQIHYNNLTDMPATDWSGIRMWVVPTATTHYSMLDPATFAINVPANGVGMAEANCVAESDFQVIAGMPHMHEIGHTFKHTLTRAATGQTETLIELGGWAFDQQYFYAMPVDVKQGDTMKIVCGYVNDKDFTVKGGQGTTDEMCYDFIYVTPESASLDCGNGFGNNRRATGP